ncbi:DUF4242 domain-containing protein [Candidatus Daviesbacteria bacterium]|nr:DUF4242 domain-containing protein [Candidatus Daviesbacteria bacterium]
MALFLGVHKLSQEMSAEDVEAGFEKYKQSAREAGLTPISAVYSMEKEFAYCQTIANSAQQVREAHEKVEIPLEDVVEVQKLD